MRYQSLVLAFSMPVLSALCGPAEGAASRSRVWLDRPWEIRYVLFAEETHRQKSKAAAGRLLNAEREIRGKEKIYLHADALFEPTAMLVTPGGEPIAVTLLVFDHAGRVVNHKGTLGQMSAKRNLLDDLVLIRNDAPGATPYYFADWSQGIPGDVTFSPAVCSPYDDRYRYLKDWNANDPAGNFGCREWTAQLYASDQPYIDVTTYARSGTFIGEVVGWSRFEDPPKPVIGRHGKTWLCLHECPAGEKPGVIPDIKAWTARHGYPMPARPRKQPLYPNADYQDDLNEFED